LDRPQGFYFAKPLSVDDVTLLLRRGNIMRGAARNRSGSAAKRGSNALPQVDEIVMVR
jgi:hypothetical protein